MSRYLDDLMSRWPDHRIHADGSPDRLSVSLSAMPLSGTPCFRSDLRQQGRVGREPFAVGLFFYGPVSLPVFHIHTRSPSAALSHAALCPIVLPTALCSATFPTALYSAAFLAAFSHAALRSAIFPAALRHIVSRAALCASLSYLIGVEDRPGVVELIAAGDQGIEPADRLLWVMAFT